MPSSCLRTLVFLLFLFIFLRQKLATSSGENDEFIFNGFRPANLTLDETAAITSDGLLMLTNGTKHTVGHAFHPSPLRFRKLHNGAIASFSTTFVFAIIPHDPDTNGHGIAFFISPTRDFSKALGSEFLGLFNLSNDGNHSTNHVFAIELDTTLSLDVHDINDNHVGIDINSAVSNQSHTAGYFADDTGKFENLSLSSGKAVQVWIDYNGEKMQLNVTLSPLPMAKPRKPLLSSVVDISSLFSDAMYVGFSASTGSFPTSHYVLGWSFKMNGTAQALDYSSLPSPPRTKSKARLKYLFYVGVPLASAGLVLMTVAIVALVVRRTEYAELLEDWEEEFGPRRFSYKDLFKATKGYNEKQLLGVGGFGGVYKGVLPSSKLEIAVKKVSHGSRQGLREFIAEIVSLGRLRHRNLVQLLGYCRRKGELLLVYDYMPNGSLDSFLYDQSKPALDWAARLRIIRGVASSVLYLHEDWEKVVVHRDIKASNVLLDKELNGRLGDFGLARLYDHGKDPLTTHVVGTIGYLAPELVRTGKATTATDVFAFGTFVLEVACGRRPVSPLAGDGEPLVLADWVAENWRKGSMFATRDPRLGEEYEVEELELVLKVGLLCLHPLPASRPGMRQVVQWLEGDAPLPELSATCLTFGSGSVTHGEGFGDWMISYPSPRSVVTASDISVGR